MSVNKYKSRYSPEKLVTAAQYITELICEKKAHLAGKDLPIYFWRVDEWKKFYKSQIFAAYGLLKIYEADAIIRAIKSPEAKRQYSLRSSKLDSLIVNEQNKLDELKKSVKESAAIDNINDLSHNNTVNEKPREPMPNRNNTLNKLRNL